MTNGQVSDHTTYPLFVIILGDGDQWTVEAEWPDGTIEQLDIFKSYYDAREWLARGSQSYARHRTEC